MAARSLREGIKEMFTLQAIRCPAVLAQVSGHDQIIESPHSGVEKVTPLRNQEMAERWAG